MNDEGSASEELAQAKREADLWALVDEKDHQIKALKAENARLRKGDDTRLTQLEQAYGDLKTLDQLKSDFLALISHELRTPLTAVLGYTDLVLRGVGGPLSSKQEHHLKTASASARELLGLINSLIEFSILEAGRDESQPTRVSLPEMVELALAPMRPIASSRDVVLKNEIHCSLPAIKADEPKLRRALESVLSNAIKFTPAGGSVILDAELAGDHVVTSVSDTGIGVPPEELDMIWEKFYQVDSSPTRKFGGLGLGLAITKKLVEMQGGRIWAESKGPDHGTTFLIELPVWQD